MEESRTYTVEISESLVRHIVSGEPAKEALEEVRRQYKNCLIVLDSEDHYYTDFNIVREDGEISGQEADDFKEAPFYGEQRSDEECVITIKETLQRQIDVEAGSEEDALEQVREMYDNGDVTLDADDYVTTEYFTRMSVNETLPLIAEKPWKAKTSHTMMDLAGYRVIRSFQRNSSVEWDTVRKSDTFAEIMQAEAKLGMMRRGLAPLDECHLSITPYLKNQARESWEGINKEFGDIATAYTDGKDTVVAEVRPDTPLRLSELLDWMTGQQLSWHASPYHLQRIEEPLLITAEDGRKYLGYVLAKENLVTPMMERMHAYPFSMGLEREGQMADARVFDPKVRWEHKEKYTILTFNALRFDPDKGDGKILGIKDIEYYKKKPYQLTCVGVEKGQTGFMRLWKDGRAIDSVRLSEAQFKEYKELESVATELEKGNLQQNYIQRYFQDTLQLEERQDQSMRR